MVTAQSWVAAAVGAVTSRVFGRGRREGVSCGNGGGNGQDGAPSEGILPEEFGNVDVPRMDPAISAPAPSPRHIPKTEDNSEEHRDDDLARTGSLDETATLRHPTRVVPEVEGSKKRKRAANWSEQETRKLGDSVSEHSTRDKGRANWEAIAEQIPGRTRKQCQQRWDSLTKRIKRHCAMHHKEVSQVTEEELEVLGLNPNVARNGDLLRKIGKCKSRMAGESSRAASTSTLGEKDIPSAAPDVLLPTSTTTASAVGSTEPVPVATPRSLVGSEAAADDIQPHPAPDHHTDAMAAEARDAVHFTDDPFSGCLPLSYDYRFLNDLTASSHEAQSELWLMSFVPAHLP